MKNKRNSRGPHDVRRTEQKMNTWIRIFCLIVVILITAQAVHAGEETGHEEERQKQTIRIVLRPVKLEGEPDPDLTEDVRKQVREQLFPEEEESGQEAVSAEELVDRLTACVAWEYSCDDVLLPDGEDRLPGKSDIWLTFGEDPEYTFLGQVKPDPACGGVEDEEEEDGPDGPSGSDADETGEASDSAGEQTEPGIPSEFNTDIPEGANGSCEETPEEMRSYLTTVEREVPEEGAEGPESESDDIMQDDAAPDGQPGDGTEGGDAAAGTVPAGTDSQSGKEPDAESPAEGTGAVPAELETIWEEILTSGHLPERIHPAKAAVSSGQTRASAETAQPARRDEEPAERFRLLRTDRGTAAGLTEQDLEAAAAEGPEKTDWQALIAPLPENDGLYTLSVMKRDEKGEWQKEDMSFSVNRFGSVYVYGQAVHRLRNRIVTAVTAPLIVSEYDPDPLLKDSWKVEITRDGQPVEPVRCQVREAENTDEKRKGWHRYDYVIEAENFAEDGAYRVKLSSRDTAGNAPETHAFNGGTIGFTVDGTPPEIVRVQGLEEPVVSGEETRTVCCSLLDTIGLKEADVFVNGKKILHAAGFPDRNRAEIRFSLAGEGEQKIRVRVRDLAGNTLDTDAKDADGRYAFRPPYPFERTVTVLPEPPAGSGRRMLAALLAGIGTCTVLAFFLLRRFLQIDETDRDSL